MYRRSRPQAGRQIDNTQAQTTIELALTIICAVILFIGAIRIFFWLNETLVFRQEEYEQSRDTATNADSEWQAQVDEARLPPLRVFND